jgi:hypothetical protein
MIKSKVVGQRFLKVLFFVFIFVAFLTGFASAIDCPPATAVSGSFDGTEATQDGRIFRDGFPSTCSGKTYPGNVAGTQLYETYTYRNCGSQNACVTVDWDEGTMGVAAHAVAYLNSYDPNNRSLNYLGDVGSSVSQPFSFTVPANQNLVLVVNTNFGPTTGDYSFTISGFPCQSTGSCSQQCAHTMNVPTSPTNIGTFAPGIYMNYDPMTARPFGLEEAGDTLTGGCWLPCWRNGHVDIYLVLDAPAYGGKFMLSEFHQWLPFPAMIQPWMTYTDDDVYTELFSLQKSGILPGNYKLDVIVVPSGTAASTIEQIVSGSTTAPYYKWSFTETLP